MKVWRPLGRIFLTTQDPNIDRFDDLKQELMRITPQGVVGESPDRADAAVHGLTYLFPTTAPRRDRKNLFANDRFRVAAGIGCRSDPFDIPGKA